MQKELVPTRGSLIGHVPSDEEGERLALYRLSMPEIAPEVLRVVGHCPHCGAPIYGLNEISLDTDAPFVKHSCDCRWHKGRSVENKEHA